MTFCASAIVTAGRTFERTGASVPTWLVAATLLFTLALFQSTSGVAFDSRGSILGDDVRGALERFTDGTKYASEAQRAGDQAILFANNDAINAAGLTGEIPISAYQAAQTDFDRLNTEFGRAAATEANANFMVQERPGTKATTFSPGTDSDFITVVGNKHQIDRMQTDYNRRVNEFLQSNGAITEPRTNWHNKLDTDFMADPRFVSEADFREIAKMNNDAYKRSASANFERISRTEGGGKIGPQHVTDYTADMSDFVSKKRGKISDMFKNPSNFNDPMNRAKVIQMMAQEQKYISRMEALDDYLRAQEGLPPRNRGLTTAKQGSVRAPSNIQNIEDAHKVANISQGTAVDDLVDTMSEIAKTKPDSPFAKSSADDVAKLIAQAPAEHRGAVIAKLSQTNPDLAQAVKQSPHFSDVDDIVRNADKITDLTRSGDAAADTARAADKLGDTARAADKLGDTARAADKLGDTARAAGNAAKAGIKQGLAKMGKTLETVGKVGAGVDVAVHVAQMNDLRTQMQEAWDAMNDPNISDEEAAKIFEKADRMGWDLFTSAGFAAAVEANPYLAAGFGVVTVACIAGRWNFKNRETGETVGRPAGLGESLSCDSKHHWDAFVDLVDHKLTGEEALRRGNEEAVCGKIEAAVADGRMVPLHENTAEEICAAMKRGGPAEARGMWQPGKPKETETAAVDPSDEEAEDLRQPGACQVAENHYTKGHEAYIEGDPDAYKAALRDAEQTMADLPHGTCGELVGKVAKGHEQAEVLGRVKEAAGGLLASCQGSDARDRARRMRTLSRLLAKTDHAYVRDLRRRLDAAQAATLIYASAKDSFDAADLDGAKQQIPRAEAALGGLGGGDCPDLRDAVENAPKIIDKWQDAARKVDQSIASCDQQAMGRYKTQLSKLSATKTVAESLTARVQQASDRCQQEAIDAAEAKAAAAAADRLSVCHKDYGRGYSVGHVLDDGRFFCMPDKATANSWCRNKNGEGFYAANINSRGGFSCLPTQKTADAWCQNKNGSGWYAGKVKTDGTYNCNMGKSARSASCRQQYGRGWYSGKLRGDGTFMCYGPRQTTTTRNPRPRTTAPRGPSNAEVGAAIGAAIAAGIIASQRGSGGGGGGSRSKCHRNPNTGQLHCGGN